MHVKYLVPTQAHTNYSINGVYDDDDGVDDKNNGEKEKKF